MLGLCDLPSELIHLLLIYTGPDGVVVLRQTCKLLNDLTRDRALWIKLLQEHCHAFGIPWAYFCPWDLPSDELELAVRSHSSFQSVLFTNAVPVPTTTTEDFPVVRPSTIAFLPSFTPTSENVRWLGLDLLPGGRLLCAVNEEEVHVYDLRGRTGSQFELIARAPYKDPNGGDQLSIHFDESPRDDGSSARLVLCSHEYPTYSTPAVISSFELRSLDHSKPTLLPLETLQNNAFSVMAVHSGMPMLFTCRGRSFKSGLGLWDFQTNHAIRWDVGTDNKLFKANLLKEFVVCITTDIRIYSIPPLSKLDSTISEAHTLKNHLPLRIVEIAGLLKLPESAFFIGFAAPFTLHQGPKSHYHPCDSPIASCNLVLWPSEVNDGRTPRVHRLVEFGFSYAPSSRGGRAKIEPIVLLSEPTDVFTAYPIHGKRLKYGDLYISGSMGITPGVPIGFLDSRDCQDKSSDDRLRARSCWLGLEVEDPNVPGWNATATAIDKVSGRVVRDAGNRLMVLDY